MGFIKYLWGRNDVVRLNGLLIRKTFYFAPGGTDESAWMMTRKSDDFVVIFFTIA
jgi:hypothetical protein